MIRTSVAKWFSGLGRWLHTSCPSLLWVQILTGTLDIFIWICDSTQVPVCAWNNAQSGIWGLPPPVKLESCHNGLHCVCATWKPNQKKKENYSQMSLDCSCYKNYNIATNWTQSLSLMKYKNYWRNCIPLTQEREY
jgi:hypothetical protein